MNIEKNPFRDYSIDELKKILKEQEEELDEAENIIAVRKISIPEIQQVINFKENHL